MDKKTEIAWSPEARERLNSIPSVLRPMVENGVNKYAAQKGLSLITPEVMLEVKRMVHGDKEPEISSNFFESLN